MSRSRVLVVDDHDGTLGMIARPLREEFSVWVARNAQEATEVANELKWDADLLVVDLMLGDGPRGDEFAAHYRSRQKRATPVIVISGAPESVELDRGAAIVAVVNKPFELGPFRELVRAVIRRSRSQALDGPSANVVF